MPTGLQADAHLMPRPAELLTAFRLPINAKHMHACRCCPALTGDTMLDVYDKSKETACAAVVSMA
jgi:hypothetical protein